MSPVLTTLTTLFIMSDIRRQCGNGQLNAVYRLQMGKGEAARMSSNGKLHNRNALCAATQFQHDAVARMRLVQQRLFNVTALNV